MKYAYLKIRNQQFYSNLIWLLFKVFIVSYFKNYFPSCKLPIKMNFFKAKQFNFKVISETVMTFSFSFVVYQLFIVPKRYQRHKGCYRGGYKQNNRKYI